MGQNILKNAFGKIKLPDKTKNKVWQNLRNAAGEPAYHLSETKQKTPRPKNALIQKWCIASLCVCLVTVILVYVQSGGSIAGALKKLWDNTGNPQEVVDQTVNYAFHGLDMAEFIDCNEERVIFASTLGLILYDRKQKRVVGTIDLKEIGCYYFEDDIPTTRFLPEKDRLTIYNHHNKNRQESSYIYDLSQCRSLTAGEVKALKPVRTEIISDSLDKRWAAYQKESRRDTYETEVYAIFGEELLSRESWIFSPHAILWKGTNDGTYVSTLAVSSVKDNDRTSGKTEYRFFLCTKDVNSGKSTEELLELRAELPDTQKKQSLPDYKYKTEDPIVKALADCAIKDPTLFNGVYYDVGITCETHYPDDTLILPVINIYEIRETKKYTKVYGDFSICECKRSGNMLYETGLSSGFTGYGCAYLQKNSHGYEVEKIVHPRDGSYMIEDMAAMCDNDITLSQQMYKKYSSKGQEIRRKEIIRMIKDYISTNKLNIQYYKEDLQSPIKLDF